MLSDGRAAEALGVLDKHPAPAADHHALRGAVLTLSAGPKRQRAFYGAQSPSLQVIRTFV